MNILSTIIYIVAGVFLCKYFGNKFKRIKLPNILAALLVGLFLSPHGLGSVLPEYLAFARTATQTKLFATVQTMSLLSLGALMGFSLKKTMFKKMGKQLIYISLVEMIVSFICVSVPLYFILNIDIMLTVLISSISVAIMPAIAISIVNELKPKGPIANLAVPLASVNSTVTLLGVLVVVSFVLNYYNLSAAPMYYIGLMFLLSSCLALFFSFVFKWASKSENKNVLIISFLLIEIVTIMIAGRVNGLFKYSMIMPPLFGIVFGASVVNTYKEEVCQKVMKALGPVLGLLLVINVFLIGTGIDVKLLGKLKGNLLVGAVVYLVFRIIGKLLGTHIGSRISGAHENVRKYVGFITLGHAAYGSFFVFYITQELTKVGGNPIVYMDMGLIEFVGIIVIGAALMNDVIAVILGPLSFKLANETGN